MCDISSSHYSYENPSLPAIDVVAKLTPKKCLTVLFFISSSSSPTADQVTQHVQSATDILRDKWSSSKPPTLHHDTVPPSSAQDLKDEIQQEIQKIPQQDAAAPPPPGLSAYGDEDYGTSLNPEPVKKLPTAKAPGPRMNATFVTLARNSDVWEISESIRQVEDRFNDKFGYDWVFLNDEPFDDEFKQVTTKLVSGKTKYGLIPKEHWSFPEWIDQDKAAAVRKKMEEDQIIYGGSISYRHMCRFESGFFFRQPLMNEYEYYWRVEPSIKLFCDIDYDVFKYMADNKKKYSFVLSLYEYRETIPTLWDSVKSFMKENPQYIAKDNSMPFLSDDGGNEYNHCHFWSNFEIGNLNWLRSKEYIDFFTHLDKAGGFFYERWGDAPVHSIAASLLLQKDEIHFFNDIGYWHVPFFHCPTDEKFRTDHKCHCDPGRNFDWNGYSCTAKWYDLHGLQHPQQT